MKIYDFVGAPNPKKVRIYLAEKGLQIPLVPVNIVTGENRTREFLAKNPAGGLPVLELDDGTCLPESLAIIQYLEELNPSPPMIGTTPLERARVRSLERVAELGVLYPVATYFQNTHPFMAQRVPKQSPDAAENAKAALGRSLKLLDATVGKGPFVAGPRPTIADCTLWAAYDFAEFAGIPLGQLAPEAKNLAAWHAGFRERPSAKA
ncbi:MAG TPA: glutathione S-transferase family protein [Candidatus Binatia bacterium]|jgi:glutathione S-transferase|nr:glutathione S-transferase family protein [Candidatus Binatia bacterium]